MPLLRKEASIGITRGFRLKMRIVGAFFVKCRRRIKESFAKKKISRCLSVKRRRGAAIFFVEVVASSTHGVISMVSEHGVDCCEIVLPLVPIPSPSS